MTRRLASSRVSAPERGLRERLRDVDFPVAVRGHECGAVDRDLERASRLFAELEISSSPEAGQARARRECARRRAGARWGPPQRPGRLHSPSSSSTRDAAPLGADELALLQLAADRSALAIDHGRVFERDRQIAQTLQRSRLPERLPDIPGVAPYPSCSVSSADIARSTSRRVRSDRPTSRLARRSPLAPRRVETRQAVADGSPLPLELRTALFVTQEGR